MFVWIFFWFVGSYVCVNLVGGRVIGRFYDFWLVWSGFGIYEVGMGWTGGVVVGLAGNLLGLYLYALSRGLGDR